MGVSKVPVPCESDVHATYREGTTSPLSAFSEYYTTYNQTHEHVGSLRVRGLILYMIIMLIDVYSNYKISSGTVSA